MVPAHRHRSQRCRKCHGGDLQSGKFTALQGAMADHDKARLNQEVARQGFLPYASLLASNRPFNAPMGGLIVHYVPSLLVIVLPPSTTVYAFIADTEGYAGQFFAFAVGAGLLLLRVRKPDLVRPYKAWIPAIWLRLLLCILLIAAPLFPPKSGEGDVDFFYASYALVGVGM